MTLDPLEEWRSRLAHLQVSLAQASDPAQKFTLERQIAEAEGWIVKRGNQALDASGESGTEPRIDLHPPPRGRRALPRPRA